MSGFRVYLPDGAPESGPVELPATEAHHLVRVLRARRGDPVTLFDGRGEAWQASLAVVENRRAVAEVHGREALESPGHRLILVLALVKGKAFDEIIRQATQLGVTEIRPVATAHCEVKLDGGRAASKLDHWRAVAVEACKQSGNLRLPEILEPLPLSEAVRLPAGLKLVASLEEGTVPLVEALQGASASAPWEIAIGPEGDFSPAEYGLLRGAGYRPVSLARHVLRAETAALYALSVMDAHR
ncbi:16S rRNA (uracil(1498)-N(3))-methyltransferase [Ruficoccus amylovorans]|uniref:Ribosomal RNA small subunit methyltransferase E n=1 Tax=Ruficoccus amylovorans TaxID=1804625 RepID=A0A842HJJ2_9BACT|nr:RsmE family RNA methyltransferase [Ruficoccus amylovorans]MBC2595804.1 16S rRNA (uracil(1498)-N(3))-methyltransferase [Ruficoccus amylovorans]